MSAGNNTTTATTTTKRDWERDSGMGGDAESDIGEFGRRASDSYGDGDYGGGGIGGVDDVRAQIAMQGSIRYNGGGHVNHCFFWMGLAPVSILPLQYLFYLFCVTLISFNFL